LSAEWLDNWKGLGHVVVGMQRQGYALSLTKITDDGWRATFQSSPQLTVDGFASDRQQAVARRAARGVGGGDEGSRLRPVRNRRRWRRPNKDAAKKQRPSLSFFPDSTPPS
jgi:hypothetical protein